MTVKPTNCARCTTPIVQKPTGRPRRYCPPCGHEVEREQKAAWTRQYRRKTNRKVATK
jgi:uncharacterized Zn finger protein (UPF0148 family)